MSVLVFLFIMTSGVRELLFSTREEQHRRLEEPGMNSFGKSK
jgi:hypothetical protein